MLAIILTGYYDDPMKTGKSQNSSAFPGVPVSCNKDCGGGCHLLAEVENGRLVKVRDHPGRPHFMRGCYKGYRIADTLYHPERLLSPLIRTGERGEGAASFRRASWEEALDLVAREMERSVREDGPSGLMRLGGSGSCRGALHNTERLAKRFFTLRGGFTDTRGNYSSEASDFVKMHMFGTDKIGMDIRTLQESSTLVLWGFNPFEARFGSETEEFLLHLSRRGCRIVVIDPRETETVRSLKAQWIAVNPGTDGVLISSILYLILNGHCGTVDWEALRRYSVGMEELRQLLSGEIDGLTRDPRWAGPLCGLGEGTILELARMFMEEKPVALLPGLSLQRTLGGEETDRLCGALQLASGNAPLSGGSNGSSQWNSLPKPECGRIPVPPAGNPEDFPSIPVYQWPDGVLQGRSGGFPSDPSLLYCVGGNFIGQGSDVEKSRAAFRKARFSVVHDLFLTETASHADVVFPVAAFPERRDICFTNGPYLFFSSRAVPPPEEVKSDFEIFSLLAERLGFRDAFTGGMDEEEWISWCLDHSEVEDRGAFFQTGIYRSPENHRRGLSDFFADPVAHPLSTPSGKIEIRSSSYQAAGGPELPAAWIPRRQEQYPLFLITPKEKFRIHSQGDNIPRVKRLCRDHLLMHPSDGAARGLEDGDQVIITSSRGKLFSSIRLTEAIIQGTVSLNQGAWPRFNREAGCWEGSVNFLTSTRPTLPSKGSRTHSNCVEVTKWQKNG